MPQPSDNIKIVTYAEDLTLLLYGPNASVLHIPINAYLEQLQLWLIGRHLNLSPDNKSMATFFTISAEGNFQTSLMIGLIT